MKCHVPVLLSRQQHSSNFFFHMTLFTFFSWMSSLLFLVVVHLIMGTQGQRFADWAIIVPQHYLKLRNPTWRLKVPLPLNLELVIMWLWSVRYCHLIEFVVLFSVFLADKIIRKKKLFFKFCWPLRKSVFLWKLVLVWERKINTIKQCATTL